MTKKIVKLNKTHQLDVRQAGFTHAIRFSNVYSEETIKIEQAARKLFGGMGWNLEKRWYTRIGRSAYAGRPYWLYFRSESDITMLLLLTAE
jgi:hypothetical protein